MLIGLVEYAGQDARNLPSKPDTFYVIRAPLPLIADEQLQAELGRTVDGSSHEPRARQNLLSAILPNSATRSI